MSDEVKQPGDDEEPADDTEGHYLQLADSWQQAARERGQDFEREARDARRSKEAQTDKRRSLFRR